MMRIRSQWRNLRGYATKLFHTSQPADGSVFRPGPILPPGPPPLYPEPPLVTPLDVIMLTVLFGGSHAFCVWGYDRCTNKCQSWKIEPEVKSMLKELHRKKKESPETYLQTIKREIQNLKLVEEYCELLSYYELKDFES